jgi:hypothetical protein
MTATGNPAKVVSCRCEIAQVKRLAIMRGWNSNGQPGWPRLSHDQTLGADAQPHFRDVFRYALCPTIAPWFYQTQPTAVIVR